MHTTGHLAPETETAAREAWEAQGRTAQTVVKQVARAMGFDGDEYDARVTTDVVRTAREVLFAAELAVHVGTRTEYEDWLADYDGEVVEFGSEHVDHVAWHAAPWAETVVATTYADAERAAVETLRRQAFGRVYADLF
jgi:hypothetical protein